jgi:uncharacterized protein (TIGR02646 family)
MIQISELPLKKSALDKLAEYQQRIDQEPDYAKRVELAKKAFSRQNKKTNATFKAVRSLLSEMCSGSRRCMYCEDSCADEVEHIQPKDLYPESVFVWENYLYACGPCNGGKSNKYAVFDATTGKLTEVNRKSTDPVAPPIPGVHVLLNPRKDDPLNFISLDIIQTFNFIPSLRLNQADRERAEYTIEVLALNRDILPPARHEAYLSYRAKLREYAEEKAAGAPAQELLPLKAALLQCQHPTVWHEMKRLHAKIPKLKELFDRVPEALTW